MVLSSLTSALPTDGCDKAQAAPSAGPVTSLCQGQSRVI